MNLTTSIARFVAAVCARFTALLEWLLKAQDFIQQINSYQHLWISRVRHALNAGVIHRFDIYGTLQARAFSKAQPEPLRRFARGVAVAIGIALCLPMAQASSGSMEAINPKIYIRLSMNHVQAHCLLTLYGKESAFNQYAIGNLSGRYHTYGIPQLKNPIIYDKSAIEQIQYGIKYIRHRYNGDTCKALHHWKIWGWH